MTFHTPLLIPFVCHFSYITSSSHHPCSSLFYWWHWAVRTRDVMYLPYPSPRVRARLILTQEFIMGASLARMYILHKKDHTRKWSRNSCGVSGVHSLVVFNKNFSSLGKHLYKKNTVTVVMYPSIFKWSIRSRSWLSPLLDKSRQGRNPLPERPPPTWFPRYEGDWQQNGVKGPGVCPDQHTKEGMSRMVEPVRGQPKDKLNIDLQHHVRKAQCRQD